MRNFCTHLILQHNLQLYLLTFNSSDKKTIIQLIIQLLIQLSIIRNNYIYYFHTMNEIPVSRGNICQSRNYKKHKQLLMLLQYPTVSGNPLLNEQFIRNTNHLIFSAFYF